MNAERLLVLYERVAEAPDAITRLRRFILDLAVRGKLTECEFETGRSVPLGKLAEFIMGQAPPGNSYNDGGRGTIFVKVGEFGERFPIHAAWTTEPLKFAKQGDVLICVVGATIGKLNLGIDCAIGRSVAAIRPQSKIDQVFLYYSLMPFTLRLREESRGTAQGVISRSDLAVIPIWCPPLDEQRRIVAKVDELMALCDRLEAARKDREAKRDRLSAASLARLNTPDPETFAADARFTLEALPALTTRPNQIKQLRQTILNLAVRGKLVPQDPNDEPVAKRYQQELGGLEIPASWRVLNFGKFCDIEGGNQPPKSQFIDEPREGYVRLLQIRDLGERPVPVYIPIASARSMCKEGEILIGRYGASVGKVFWAQDGAYNVAMAKFIWPNDAFISAFAYLLLKSEYLQGPLAKATRSAQAGFNKGDLSPIEFPLPPLAEQHRIVAKVDELMALCDRLEASLTTSDQTRTRLLDGLLAEALAPEAMQ